ncbi:MAG: ABC transporter permease [Bdellovibrionales bacterium]|nr:ABC transporter permease [Bdellovibrionales bacterium]
MLPREWWKLSLLWFVDLKARTPPFKRSLLTNSFHTAVLGLALGVAALSVTLAIFTGAERVFARGITASLSHITHFTQWHTNEELDHMVALAPPGVERAVYFWTSQGLLVGPKGGRGVMIEGRRNTGTAVTPGGPVLVDLGKPLAEILGLKPGDKFRILLPGILKGSVEAQLRDVLQFGMHDVDSRLAVVIDESLRPLLESQDPESYRKRPGDAHGIRFWLQSQGRDPRDARWVEKWRDEYEKNLERAHLTESNALFRTWKDLQRNLLGSIGMDKQLLVVVMGLLTLVATLNVAATLVVLFLERDREMAALRALGLSQRGLLGWISIQGFLMGVVASTLGMALGWGFAHLLRALPIARLPADIYRIDRLPLGYDGWEQAGAFLFGIVAALGAAALLGRRLARTDFLPVLGQRR